MKTDIAKPVYKKSFPKKPPLIGNIIDARFVALKDGRRILQISRGNDEWQTPGVIAVDALSEEEREELLEALGAQRDTTAQDPSQR